MQIKRWAAYALVLLALYVLLAAIADMFTPVRFIEIADFIELYWFDYTLVGLILILALYLGND